MRKYKKPRDRLRSRPAIIFPQDGHFVQQWRRYLGREKPQKIKSCLQSAIMTKEVYGRADGSFEVAVRGTKAILMLIEGGWMPVTLLDPKCAERELERSGMGDIARKYGSMLNPHNLRQAKKECRGVKNIQIADLDLSEVSACEQAKKFEEELQEFYLVQVADPDMERIGEEAFDVIQSLLGWMKKLGVDVSEANERHIRKMEERYGGD